MAACAWMSVPAFAQKSKTLSTSEYKVNVVTVVEGLKNPWAVAFLPDGRMLVTERRGTLRVVDGGKLVQKAVDGMPKVTEFGQGGLLDVVLHPKYAENGWIYWTYNATEGGLHGTEVARGKLGGSKDAPTMTDVQVLFKLAPKSDRGFHFGSRIVFDREGYLFVTFGDRGDSPAKGAAQRAQQLNDHAGKSIRLFDDGRVPPDNPFVKTKEAKPEIFTLGNRNMQGAALNPVSGKLWTHEHGPQGGDEVNIMVPGANYGWPVVTYGVNYGVGTKIGEGTEKAGMTPPLVYWVPSIAASGMAFIGSDGNGGVRPSNFPKWKGNLLVGGLAGQLVVRLTLEGDKVVAQERMFVNELGRIRDVRNGPDGNIYLLTDSIDGALLRVEPAK
ncbi:MAG: PQQ-dependent sugar dehydrogenase [Rhodocyclaceae bacterium]|nr:PQQ-dependent sugar dehydrogenase [Rhodocyclaceae bacterium]